MQRCLPDVGAVLTGAQPNLLGDQRPPLHDIPHGLHAQEPEGRDDEDDGAREQRQPQDVRAHARC